MQVFCSIFTDFHIKKNNHKKKKSYNFIVTQTFFELEMW